MNRNTIARTVLSTAASIIFAFPQLATAATTVSSFAEGVDVNLSVLNGVATTDVPTGVAAGMAPPAYNVVNNLASLNATIGLGLGSLVMTGAAPAGTNIIADSASSTYPGTLSGTATSTVNGLTANLSLAASIINLLHISATTLTSTSTASASGGTVGLVGTSQITGLTVGDALDGPFGTTVTLGSSGTVSTPVNNLLLGAAGVNVYTNYQTPVVDNGVTDGINTAAVAVTLNNFVFGSGLLSGTILIADSQAKITGAPAAVPEPATWAMMLVGFGVTGLATRRRRVLALA